MFKDIPKEILKNYGLESDSFEQLMAKICQDDESLEWFCDEIERCADAVESTLMDCAWEHGVFSHPWYTDVQIEIFKTFMSAEFQNALTEPCDRRHLLKYDHNYLLACLVAAGDKRVENPIDVLHDMAKEIAREADKNKTKSTPKM